CGSSSGRRSAAPLKAGPLPRLRAEDVVSRRGRGRDEEPVLEPRLVGAPHDGVLLRIRHRDPTRREDTQHGTRLRLDAALFAALFAAFGLDALVELGVRHDDGPFLWIVDL